MATIEQPKNTASEEIAAIVGGRKLIVATNRGPVEFYRDQRGRFVTRRGSGGVVTALASLAQELPLTWIAVTMSDGDREAFPNDDAPAREVRLGQQMLRVRYVNVPPEVYHRHYDEVSNQWLWFLQHYLWDTARSPSFTEDQYVSWDQGYRPVNRAIAEAIAHEELAGVQEQGGVTDGSDAIVFLQDYHLYLTAERVREHLPQAVVQQFVHIPWPAIRYWEFLPERFVLEIFESLAANDVIGFQSERDARNFLECARAFLHGSRADLDQGRLIWRRHQLLARAYPVTVDTEEIVQVLNSAAAKLARKELAPLLEDDMPVIVRVDRLEPTKNIVRGFQAFAHMLELHPDLQGKVRFLAFLVPSRQSLDIYQEYDREVHGAIERVNDTYRTPDWEPITAFFENNRARALVAMQRYDVLLVNPIIDGMNLVAKEGIVVNERNGVLVLSRTAGAYTQLAAAALPVTATDIAETAEQLYEALIMSAHERQERMEKARAIVGSYSPTQWALDQLRDAALTRPVPPAPKQQSSHAS
jgi:trehalose 6-phosphate synthase